MKKSPLIVAAVLIAVLFGMSTPAAASTPSDVTIVTIMHSNPDSLPSGTFEAWGPAVEADLVCSAGTVQDLEHHFQSMPVPWLLTGSVRKLFTCEDGSGAFEVLAQFLAAPKGCSARWVITGGDGLYADLLGNGRFTCGGSQDTYLGQLHNK